MNLMSPAGIGWFAVVLLLAQIFLGKFAAGTHSAPASSPQRGNIPRNAHMIVGFVLLPLAFVHGWNSMMMKGSAAGNQFGMWMATIALVLMVVQIFWGLGLLRQPEETRRWSRKIHLGVGLGIVFLTGIHLLLNH